jgi:hypothetical protein
MDEKLTKLEAAALEAICSEDPDIAAVLRTQTASAIVKERYNSGAGYFTYLDVDRSAEPVPTKGPIGNVTADLAGLPAPVGFLLFLADGYAECLECYSCSDRDTRTFDFSSADFVIPSHEDSVRTLRTR